ncbi:UDP-N-acetylglucosamine diphosphorylase/glucosamine-1-phosphate N-acetyltransferase [bacterium]|nr:MAG: UDP-N-acetylglucosamine diphosphorylase/glucosamine-1-phosphate N-acetyltransferase [bacterium]
MKKEVVAIILAAGKGTRMKSSLSKVLHPILGVPLLGYPVEACRKAGVSDVVAVIGHQGEAVREVFRDTGLVFAVQEEQKGTGHAVLCARDGVGEGKGVALILCGDVPLIRPETLQALLESHLSSGNLVTVLSMAPENPAGYGRLVRSDKGGLLSIVEEKDATAEEKEIKEVNTGTYAVTMPWLWGALGQVGSDNSQGEYYLTDIVKIAAREGKAGSLLLGDPVEVMGINDRAQLAEASLHMRARINRTWMESGVTIEDPSSAWIEPEAVIGEDVTIGPGVSLAGRTVVGRGVVIGQGTLVKDSEIAPGAIVKPYCVIEKAFVGERAVIGPFAHLRPKSKILAEAKAGNFVEIKNSVIGDGSKVSHLSYIGDSEVGRNVNVGAGTITCNYDGANKWGTKIGDGAFIGSNSSLVAPVSIGAGAVVGAGSTITKDVPPGSLGIGRAMQKSISGWKKPVKKTGGDK